ncbi:MAG TPA: proprotein convertase P-domain-containing protein, partial [Phycisphaerae bacterium]|nr:proprotein convertase P-domain-containing protein [Phycisphaerae bacterium]
MKTQLIAQDRWCVMRTALCCLCAALLFGSVAWAQEKTAVEPTDQLAAVPGAPEDGPRQGGGSCATALEITYAQIAAGFHDVGVLDATDDCVGRPYHDVFYRYVCTHAGAYTFDMCGSAADTYLKIWTGGTCCTGSYSTSDDVCGNDPQITVALNAGTTYYFECGSYYSTETALAYNFNATITVAGACCAAGTCTITSPAACTGVYMGDSTTCSPSPCRACASMTPPNADLGVIGTVPWYSLSGNCADGKWDAQFIGLAGTIYHFDLCPDTPGSGTANFDIDIKICDAAGTILAGQDGSCVALSYRPNDFQWTCTVDGTYYVVFAPYSSYASHNCTGTAASTFTLNYYAELQLGACCYPNGHCVVTPPAGCPAPATFHPGANCGTVLPAEYHYEYPLDMPIDPFVPFENYQDGEESTPIGKIRIDLKLIGILGPLHIEVEHLGTTVVLWDYVCPSSDGMDVVFDDDGGTLNCYNLQGGVAVRPSSAGGGYLSDFRGMEYGGPWIIRIYSDQYVIIIVRWSLWVQFLDQTFICVPVPMGACCLQDGSCIHTTQADCTAQNGTSWQYAVPCSFAGCVPSTSACCWPNGRCTIETVMTCLQLGGVYYPGQTCGTVLPAEYHWEYPLNVSIDPLMPFENHQDGEESTPIGKIRIDLKLIGILGPLHIEVEHLGTTVVLWDNVCLSSDGMDVNFDDDGGTVDCLNLLGGVAVRPSSAGGGYLSDFRGMEYGGPWTIRIYSEQYVIIIVRWSLWVQFLDETYICVPIPKGACCLRDGTCIHTTRADCAARNGTRWQYAVPCSYANCQPMTGACCIGWDCSIQQGPEYCTNVLHGRYLGDNTTCDLLVRESYPGLPIPDNYPAGVSDTMDVQYNVTVTNVSVDVVINHTWIGDLIIKLTHGSTTVTLWNRVCSSNDNMNVVFDDAGTSLICATPTVGRITPTSAGGGLLSAFNGQSGRGPWTINVSDNAAADVGTLIQWSLHFGNTNPCAILDTVVCEPQDGAPENPSHPATYWYDVTPGDFGRCDFHVRVYDPNPANYTNPSLPAGWQFLVHQVGNEWWASWYNPGCTNAFFGPNPTRFQFTNPNAAVWGDWRTTIGMQADPYDVWNIDNSGHHTAEADGYGYHVHVPTFAENWYWKDCNGAAVADGYMPDFDQRQDFNGDGVQDTGYCGPTAVANSLWWFDCKFPDAGIVPAGWTPGQLIQYLAQRMDTNNQNPPSPHGHPGPFSGTYLDDMQAGIDLYLAAQGVNSLLYEHTMLRPSFDYINREVQKSQDVTLLVGFWHIIGVQQVAPDRWAVTWQRTGGHYLTVAGVDPLNNRVALSDPDGDFAEHGYSGVVRPAGTDHNHDGDNDPNSVKPFHNDPSDPNYAYDHAVHNNDTYASHDYYTLAPSISPGGALALVLDGNPLTYGELMHVYHEGENNGPYASGE